VDSVAKQSDSLQFIGFSLRQQQYAIPIQKIQEIVIPQSITRAPQVADYVEGLSNLRGAIIPIISLRKLFAIEPKPIDIDSRIIVLNVGERVVGCLVDAVTQVLRISRAEIQPVPDLITDANNSFIVGFMKLDERIVILLNVEELLDPSKIDEVSEAARRGDLPSTA